MAEDDQPQLLLRLPFELLMRVLLLGINGSGGDIETTFRHDSRRRSRQRPGARAGARQPRRTTVRLDHRSAQFWSAIQSQEHLAAVQAVRDLVGMSRVCRALASLTFSRSSQGLVLWRAAFVALRRPLVRKLSHNDPAAKEITDRGLIQFLLTHAAIANTPGLGLVSHLDSSGQGDTTDASRSAAAAAMLVLGCWLRANPSSFDVKKDLLVHALAIGFRPASRLIVGPQGRTALTFRYAPGTPRTWQGKFVRRERCVHSRGRAGMTLLQAVILKGAQLAPVPEPLPPNTSFNDETWSSSNSSSAWEYVVADAITFVLEADQRSAAAIVNERSCGGKTALDIAYEIFAYWQRSGPWSSSYFGAPGSGKQKGLALYRARVLERAIQALQRYGGRCAVEGRDLLMCVRSLDVERTRKELSAAELSEADTPNGVIAKNGIFSARNFRGLTALPLAVEQVFIDPPQVVTLRNDDEGEGEEQPEDVIRADDQGLPSSWPEDFPLAHLYSASSYPFPDDRRPDAIILDMLLDAGASADSLAELFTNDSGWWNRLLTHSYCDWAAVHMQRLLCALDSVFAMLDDKHQERCLASQALAAAIVERARSVRGDFNLSYVPCIEELLMRFGVLELGRRRRSSPRSAVDASDGERGRQPLRS
ncbi:hypothetical protein DFJ73DRAFT_888707 [Zopfochytrium polystomum]|nr:hypothetical protein DFJ73DRAFT_888707 [Zopfochytrium polystomum]